MVEHSFFLNALEYRCIANNIIIVTSFTKNLKNSMKVIVYFILHCQCIL